MTDAAQKKLGATEIAALIRIEITNGNLQLNDRLLPERQLAEEFQAARGTIRKALDQLVAEKYVEIRASSGTYVIYQHNDSAPAIENANPLELMDARFALEPHICRLAVLHGRRSDFDALEELCARMENGIEKPGEFAAADTEFHRTLSKCTGNGLLIWIIDQITSVRSQEEWTQMRHLTLNQSIIAQYNNQHRMILDAIRAREPERAANMMKEHLETARLSLTRAAET